LVVSLALAYGLFQPGGKQGADGSAFKGSKNPSFPQQICLNLQCDVGFHGCTSFRAAQVYVLHTESASTY
jgi:hypothetical protein